MTLEQTIRQLAAEGTRQALEEHLPSLLSELAKPIDLEERLTYEEAAEWLRLPLETLKKRVYSGVIPSFQDGKRAYIKRRDLVHYNDSLRAQAQFERDQKSPPPVGTDPEIAELLGSSPTRKGSAKKTPGSRRG